jgi:hypothetical protein
MSQQSPEQPDRFNADPELAAAVKRVAGGHVADEELRRRVASILGGAAPAMPFAPAPRRAVWMRRLAVAACILVLLGGGAVYLRERQVRLKNEEYVQLHRGLLKAMVAVHVNPVPDAAERLPTVDPQPVQAALSRKLSRRIPLPDLSVAGWQLRDAMTQPFGTVQAARFDFIKGPHTVTLISVPKRAFYGAEADATYDATIDGHPISGFVANDGVHCLVGDSSMPLSEITALRKQIQPL